jgi:hypothetical protein
MPEVFPYNRSGTWERPTGYRAVAHDALFALKQAVDVRHAIIAPSWPHATMAPRDGIEPGRPLEHPLFFAEVVVIYSLMSVEGFLNDYGVKRLTERYFGDHLERLPAGKKLQRLVDICLRTKLSDTHPCVVAARQLSMLRNSLVHPKTSESSLAVSPPHLPPLSLGEAATQYANEFFREFALLDPDVDLRAFW